MIGALWTGISGLSAHQKALDNESHNIANVNCLSWIKTDNFDIKTNYFCTKSPSKLFTRLQ